MNKSLFILNLLDLLTTLLVLKLGGSEVGLIAKSLMQVSIWLWAVVKIAMGFVVCLILHKLKSNQFGGLNWQKITRYATVGLVMIFTMIVAYNFVGVVSNNTVFLYLKNLS